MQTKASPLRADVPDFVLELIDRAAALGIPGARRTVLAAFEALVEGIGVGEIAEAVASGSAGPIFATTTPWTAFEETLLEAFGAKGALARTMTRAAEESIELLPDDPVGLDFDSVEDQAVAWLRRRGARLVTVVTRNTRDAINKLVQDAFAGPESVRDAAKRILDVKGFGLNRPQAVAFERYVADLTSATGPGSELTAKQVQRLIDQKYQRMLRHRARVIAKTEAYNAGNEAQGLLWRQAAAGGDLDANVYVQEWVTRVIRVCPRCRALDGVTAEINHGVFRSRPVDGGGKWDGTILEVLGPTVHPDCYCTRRLIRRDQAIEMIEPMAIAA